MGLLIVQLMMRSDSRDCIVCVARTNQRAISAANAPRCAKKSWLLPSAQTHQFAPLNLMTREQRNGDSARSRRHQS
jgi:hypothetical protein